MTDVGWILEWILVGAFVYAILPGSKWNRR